MAILSSRTFGRFDLLKVWANQELSDKTKIFLNSLCYTIYENLQQQANLLNTSILSYGKTKAAYNFIQELPLEADLHLLDEDLN